MCAHWSEERLSAFEALKDALAANIFFAAPHPTAPLTVATDASKIAIGGVLRQIIDGRLHTAGFYSRNLLPAKMRYSTHDIELLAIVDTLKAYQHLLIGRTFVVRTDHKPFTTITELVRNCPEEPSGHIALANASRVSGRIKS